MYWQDLNNRTVGIWGMGKEGLAAKTALKQHCPNANIMEISEDNLANISQCAVIIKSPGVSLYRSEIAKAKAEGVRFTSSSNLFFANKTPSTKVVAITGTKGKSTTASLLAHSLQYFGKKVELAGNIGRSLVELADTSADWVIAEMSSYQCADLAYGADIGVLLNLYPEHLHWHQTHARYYADKLNMIAKAEIKLLNAQDKRTSELTGELKGEYFNTADTIHLENGCFYDGAHELFAMSKLNLAGEHNCINACAVLSVLKIMGEPLSKYALPFASFTPLAHRLQNLGKFGGIEFVDDSISTTPETAAAAVRALDKGQPLTLIVGGFDRGQDHTSLIDELAGLKERLQLVVVPDTGARIIPPAEAAGLKTSAAADMHQAVACAIAATPAGGTVILSPAAPSYNAYKNFEERGKDFSNCIKSLAK